MCRCQKCNFRFAPRDDIKNEYGKKLRVLKIDVDKNNAASAKYKVRGVPTFLLFKKGEIVWRSSGVHSRADFKKQIDSVL